MHLSATSRLLLQDRYLLDGESPEELWSRVAGAVDSTKAKDFRYLMENLLFLPNSPTLMNAGTPLGQLSACFVLPVEDSLERIFQTLTHMALTHKSGGGTGFSFSRIRPRGDVVERTSGIASGPLSFIRVFDAATAAVKQGGKRRGANMGVLASSHPDIMEFIRAKTGGGLTNFNLSVGYDAHYFQCLSTRRPYPLINPRDGEIWAEIDPHEIWRACAGAAWACGDPGVLFLDEINRKNTVPGCGMIEATNPCGEQPLLPYESCNLGSINLSACVKHNDIDCDLLTYITRTAVDFLDAVIDVNRFPVPEISEQTRATRKIGLGVMGFAEMLILLGIPYASKEAIAIAGEAMGHVHREARARSAELGEWKGSFPAIDRSIFSGPMRNATVTTIAPTGSLHIIADTSSGIEPLFTLAYHRTIVHRTVNSVNRLLTELAEKRADGRSILEEVRKVGSIQHLPLDEHIRELFRTADEISAEHHVRMQAAFQQYTDNAVSKTVNMPESVSVEDVESIFSRAHMLGCKGITVYRENSKSEQVIHRGCDVCAVE
ncbi:MAG: adenosylcobalamin-dependent ribonucleoside-diphosphate reductase [Methanomicrobiaceae archaeon]|nr:adenosylcobalamin-dependent ribonucleoside-diphosphate reductase [Methanomicrobiaceae archaeon]